NRNDGGIALAIASLRPDIFDMKRPTCCCNRCQPALGMGYERLVEMCVGIRGWHIVARDEGELLAVVEGQGSEFCAANAYGILHDRLEQWRELFQRVADRGQYFRRRGLLLKRLREVAGTRLQIVEQADILDRDHRLVRERRD